jgi:putative ABC transport system permease protein
MLFNIIKNSFINQKKSMILMISSVAVGTALAASLITLAFEISGKVSNELRAFGANILVEPTVEGLADITGQKRYLNEEDILKVKTIFWRHNILGISPFLETDDVISHDGNKRTVKLAGAWYEKELPVPGEKKTFKTGISTVSPWWAIEGNWPASDNEVILGITLASEMGIMQGDDVNLGDTLLNVTGILDTGGPEDDQVFMKLQSLQTLKGMQGKVSKVYVSALTRPMDEFAYKDPDIMTPTEYEKWYCTGYVTSIAKQVEEVFSGSNAKPIWKVAATEGNVLGKLEVLTYLLCIISLAASALGVSTTMIMSLLRRSEEIGLMKALGAARLRIVTIFVTEGFFIGLLGGILGYIVSIAVSQYIGMHVFNTGLQQKGYLMLIAIGSAILIALAGTVLPIKRALYIKPGIVLKEAK